MKKKQITVPGIGDDWQNMPQDEYAKVLAKVKANAEAKREREAVANRAVHYNTYDSHARRQARRDVQCVMAKYSEVPAHFGYTNVFGHKAAQVML
jgi:hypothetical protein